MEYFPTRVHGDIRRVRRVLAGITLVQLAGLAGIIVMMMTVSAAAGPVDDPALRAARGGLGGIYGAVLGGLWLLKVATWRPTDRLQVAARRVGAEPVTADRVRDQLSSLSLTYVGEIESLLHTSMLYANTIDQRGPVRDIRRYRQELTDVLDWATSPAHRGPYDVSDRLFDLADRLRTETAHLEQLASWTELATV